MMMKKNYQAGSIIFWLGNIVCLLSMITTMAGCIHEDEFNCPREIFLRITVHTDNEEDNNHAVETATIFIFDENKSYSDQIQISGSQIRNNELISLPVPPQSKAWIVVWGNLKENELITSLSPGISMEQIRVELQKDKDGNSLSPDDLFYGMKQLSGKQLQEEIIISPKVGRINVTVKGLQERTPTNYYFTVESHYRGYNFSGIPLEGNTKTKMSGTFYGNDFITNHPYNLIHYPLSTAGNLNSNGSTVKLWKKGSENDVLLAKVDKDTHNNFILPQAGKTINILFYFKDNGEMEVMISLTGWDEIAEWFEW